MADFYPHATTTSFDFSDYKDLFDEAFIIFCQYFKDSVVRDLDNRNKKYIQDAIRHSRIIVDDHWKYVSNINMGFSDELNHTQVFVVEKKNIHDFFKELLGNNDKYKCIECIKENKESFIKMQEKAIKKQIRSNKKTAKKVTKNDSFYN